MRIKVAVVLLMCLAPALAAEMVMRISVENTPSHVQTRAVERFAERLKERLKGRVEVRLYTGAELFRDQDVFSAIARGRLEMAVPGTWLVEKLVSEAGIFLMPDFFSRPAALNHAIMESPIGAEINGKIEEGLGVRVIGGWIDLGHALVFTREKRVDKYEDIAGMRLRVAGGKGNEARIAALGGIPVVVAFPDLPAQLEQGKIGGVITTYETVRSAELWKYGLRYAFEDNQFFGQYVPIVAEEFWERLPDDVRAIIAQTWNEGVEQARNEARAAQENAKKEFTARGGSIMVPPESKMTATRLRLARLDPPTYAEAAVPPGLARRVTAFADSWANGR